MLDRVTAGSTAAPGEARPGEARSAAVEFEALLIGQLLQSMWEDEQAGGPMLGIAQQHLARMLAASGGLGLARMIGDALTDLE